MLNLLCYFEVARVAKDDRLLQLRSSLSTLFNHPSGIPSINSSILHRGSLNSPRKKLNVQESRPACGLLKSVCCCTSICLDEIYGTGRTVRRVSVNQFFCVIVTLSAALLKIAFSTHENRQTCSMSDLSVQRPIIPRPQNPLQIVSNDVFSLRVLLVHAHRLWRHISPFSVYCADTNTSVFGLGFDGLRLVVGFGLVMATTGDLLLAFVVACKLLQEFFLVCKCGLSACCQRQGRDFCRSAADMRIGNEKDPRSSITSSSSVSEPAVVAMSALFCLVFNDRETYYDARPPTPPAGSMQASSHCISRPLPRCDSGILPSARMCR